MIRALLEERALAEKTGDKYRVSLIDDELRRFGHLAAIQAKRAETRVDLSVGSDG